MRSTTANFERISDDLELKAAAAAAHVLCARLVRRDIGGAQHTRDFDLVFHDGRLEPLEVTRFVDRPALETWERIRRAAPLSAPSLTRRWVLALPHSTPVGDERRKPYDVKDFIAKVEPALAAIEAAGHETINLGRLQHDSALAPAFQTLLDLRIQDGISHPLEAGQAPHISLFAPVGGITNADLVASATEREAAKPDNQAKLAEPPGAQRRHLFVVFDGSGGSFFNAVDRGMQGRLPTLAPPITTAWAAARAAVLVTTPPAPWELHALPKEVFTDPERWVA
ncbi:MAG: hypothetical protein ACRDM0_23510 [Thermoleophilaceae bacterium]